MTYGAIALAFTGRPYDVVTGKQYNTWRWYDPLTCRWLSEDPIGYKGRAIARSWVVLYDWAIAILAAC
jgi:RHS repeat-associated protein